MKGMDLTKRKRTSGFTLLELLLVVIVVGILAAVVLPQFDKMARRARATEAVNANGAILTAEWVYFQENSTFSGVIGELLVNIDTTHFTYAASAVDATNTTWTATGSTTDPNYTGLQVVSSINNNGLRTDPVVTGF